MLGELEPVVARDVALVQHALVERGLGVGRADRELRVVGVERDREVDRVHHLFARLGGDPDHAVGEGADPGVAGPAEGLHDLLGGGLLLEERQVPRRGRLHPVVDAVAAGLAQGLEQLGLHRVDAGRDLELDLQARALDQVADVEDPLPVDGDRVVHEEDVVHAAIDQVAQLGQHVVGGALAELGQADVAEQALGRAAARGLHGGHALALGRHVVVVAQVDQVPGGHGQLVQVLQLVGLVAEDQALAVAEPEPADLRQLVGPGAPLQGLDQVGEAALALAVDDEVHPLQPERLLGVEVHVLAAHAGLDPGQDALGQADRLPAVDEVEGQGGEAQHVGRGVAQPPLQAVVVQPLGGAVDDLGDDPRVALQIARHPQDPQLGVGPLAGLQPLGHGGLDRVDLGRNDQGDAHGAHLV